MAQNDELVIGDSWEGTAEVLDDDGSALDITGATAEVQFRRPSGAALDLTVTVDASTDAALGLVHWSVPYADTEGLAEGPVDYGVRVTLDGGYRQHILRRRMRLVLGPVQ